MPDDLPSIASLQAFACAARTLSFKRAAEQLHRSPSALSRQIQGLESHLGIALFERLNPGLALTEAGARYLAAVERALATLNEAARSIGDDPGRPLRVSALESFSARWLVPRLPDLERRHPSLRLELEATLRHADFRRDPVDVAIRFGTGPWEGLHSEPLLDLDYIPVCSPALLRGDPPLHALEDLARHPWIHVSQVSSAWRDWIREVGLEDLQPPRELHFDHVGIALSAAESGQGIALSTPVLCAAELENGRLCIPFDRWVRSDETYHLVCRPEALDDPRIQAFRDWLIEALEETTG